MENKVWKYIKQTLWGLFIATVLLIALNVYFFKTVRDYARMNLPEFSSRATLDSANSTNRITRFAVLMAVNHHFTSSQVLPPVCQVICGSSQFDFQDSADPVSSAVLFYNQKGRQAFSDFNFALGSYAISQVSRLVPPGVLDILYEATESDSLLTDLALSLRIQFEFYKIFTSMDKITAVIDRIDSASALYQVNLVCRGKMMSEEDAQQKCRDLTAP